MGIDFSKFSKQIQDKIQAALSDDNKIDAAELRTMNLENEVTNELMKQIAGNQEFLGDGFYLAGNKNKKLILLDKPENNTFIFS